MFAKLLALPSSQLKSGGRCVISIEVAPDINFPLNSNQCRNRLDLSD